MFMTAVVERGLGDDGSLLDRMENTRRIASLPATMRIPVDWQKLADTT